jgi:hypothetical protein
LKHYRLYRIGHDGHYVGVEELDHPDDETAITAIAARAATGEMELWERGRKVIAFPVAANLTTGPEHERP